MARVLARRDLLRRWAILVTLLAAIVVLPGRGLAHEGEGKDVGFAHLTATQTNGVVTVELRISESDACDRFAPRGLVGQRAQLMVTGAVGAAEDCLFGGRLVLTEPGRWMMTVDLAYDEYPLALSMPVGMSDTTTVMERAEWLHAPIPQDHAHLPQALIFAVPVALGLLAAATVEFLRRRWVARAAS